MSDPLSRLLADIEVDAESRDLASMLYHAALAEGRTPDEALDMARDALAKMRAQWEDAKREDGG